MLASVEGVITFVSPKKLPLKVSVELESVVRSADVSTSVNMHI